MDLLLLIFLPLLLLTVSAHEYSHGWVAYKLGDTTAKEKGRLSLNPLKHLSLKYTVILPLALLLLTRGRFAFGLAKPVPINPLRFRNPQKDLIWVGLAGPFVNLFIAFILSKIFILDLFPRTHAGDLFKDIFIALILVNLILGVFNLIPIPPLDGSRVLIGLLPRRQARFLLRYELFGLVFIVAILLLAAIFLGGLINVILPPIKMVWKFFGLNPYELQQFIAQSIEGG